MNDTKTGIDAGPEWDPATGPEMPATDAEERTPLKAWTREDARRYLNERSTMVQDAIGKPLGVDVSMTPEELNRIAPGLADLVRRFPLLQAWLDKDKLAVSGVSLWGYVRRVGRTIKAQRLARRTQDARVQVTPHVQTPADRSTNQQVPSFGVVPATQETRPR